MNSQLLSNTILQQVLQQRLQDLFSTSVEFLPWLESPRDFQLSIIENTIQDILNGNIIGRWDCAVGSGKTAMALSIARHIVQQGGKVLYIGPGNIEIENGIKAHNKYQLGENNYLQFSNEDDIIGLTNPKQKKAYDQVGYYYTTAGMLTYNDRYKELPIDTFDLILFDESHGLLGDILSGPQHHFACPQIHMSATPYNMQKHVGSCVPHCFGSISSEELIEKYGFPHWEIKKYLVDDDSQTELENNNDGDFDFNSKKTHSALNLSSRFLIIENILEEIILGNEKGITYMPSIKDCEIFVKYIVENNPLLKGRVDYVGGVRGKAKNKQVKKDYISGKIKVVLSKDLWNQSLDVVDTSHIILADPTRSLRKVIQRIGRGTRPAENKETLTIHDLVSSIFHSSQYGEPAIEASSLIPRSSPLKYNSKDTPIIRSTTLNSAFINAIISRDKKEFQYYTRETNYKQRIQELYFLADIDFAIKIFATFASEIFHISYYELFLNLEKYLKNTTPLTIDFEGKRIHISLSDIKEGAYFYNTLNTCKEYDILSEIKNAVQGNINDFPIIKQRQDYLNHSNNAPQIEEKITAISSKTVLEKKEFHSLKQKNITLYGENTTETGIDKISYVGQLNEVMQEHNGMVIWNEASTSQAPYSYWYNPQIEILGKKITIETTKRFPSKKKAQRYVAKIFLNWYNSNIKPLPYRTNYWSEDLKKENTFSVTTDQTQTDKKAEVVNISNPQKDWYVLDGRDLSLPKGKEKVYLMHMNEQVQKLGGKILDWNENIENRAQSINFSYNPLIKIGDKTIEVKSNQLFPNKSKAKNHIARTFMKGITNIFTGKPGKIPEANKPQEMITIEDILLYSNIKTPVEILNQMKSKSLVSKLKVYMEGPTQAAFGLHIPSKNTTYKTGLFPYDGEKKEERKASKQSGGIELLEKLLLLPEIQNYWWGKLKNKIKK